MVDKKRIEGAVREILIAIGEDPDREGLAETPCRVADMYGEILGGLTSDPMDDVRVFQEPGNDGLVIVRDIPFQSMCEHHLMPFFGKACIAYKPGGGRILGLSKVARMIDVLAGRPQLQERLTMQLADAVMEAAGPVGSYVRLEAEHLCMTMRGVRKPGSRTVTTCMRGGMGDADVSAVRGEWGN
ncbi:MAG: GTP cyclohydrolase I FolE [Oscillospiraceae bacterium]|nr:GTP cyclohydrolase I FolE [Oscillospiraceae bacterium]